VVKQLLETITLAQVTPVQAIEIITMFLFSMGASLEKHTPCNNEEVLQRYAQSPTFGNALMAQSTWMRDTWSPCITRKEKEDGRTTD